MSSPTRALLSGGAAYIAFNSATIALADDSKLELVQETSKIKTALDGDVDEVGTDVYLTGSGSPATWENLSVLFPWLNPQNGPSIFTNSDVPAVWTSENGDTYTLTAAGITKMPEIFLGLGKPIMGPMEFTGVCGTGLAPSTANALYTIGTASYTAPAITPAKFGQCPYSAAWGSVTGFGSLTAEDGWSISHQLEIVWKKAQGLRLDAVVKSYQCTASARIVGPTQAQIDTAFLAQGTSALWGKLCGPQGFDLVITGGNSGPVVTVKSATLKKGGWQFGSGKWRNDMYSFQSARIFSSGVPAAALTVA